MARRKPSGWHYSGVVRGKKRREKKRSRMSRRGRQGIFDLLVDYAARLAGWALFTVVNKKWRPLSFSEALVWLGAAAVCIAFLTLMAGVSFLLAAAIFLLMVAFAWRELGEK